MNILTSLSLNRINDQLRAVKSWTGHSVYSFNSKADIDADLKAIDNALAGDDRYQRIVNTILDV